MDYLKTLQGMSKEQIRAVIEAIQQTADSYLYMLDMDTDTFVISEKMVERFPFEKEIVSESSKALEKVVYPSDFPKLKDELAQCASGEKTEHGMEYRWVDRKGKIVWIECRGRVIRDEGGHKLLVGRVVELSRRSRADGLTGLRKEERFRRDVETILRDRPWAIRYIMRIGIDNFKEINEKEGIEAGDEVLKELAECINDTVNEDVDVYRLVADEFVIVDASAGSIKRAETVYNQIRKKVAQLTRKTEYSRFYTISAGVMEDEFIGKSADETLKLTEFALNEAKRNGKNQMAWFDKAVYEEYLRRLDMRKVLRRDVNNHFHGFQVFYQPIVSTDGYKLIGAEALLRWNSEEYGNVSPAVFIPILEESGLIIPVGKYVLWDAARTCKEWKKEVPHFHVNVNLSYVQIHKSDLMKDLNKCIKEVGIAPESLVLELTESGYIETDNRIKELFRDLKERKIALALDDFGTGYSNMRYLKEIEAKTVKIDRSFVVQALQNEHDYNIISHIIDMVHSLGSSVCMEGIEEKEELNKMMKTKPDMIQGYYFGKPSPKDVFEKEFIDKA